MISLKNGVVGRKYKILSVGGEEKVARRFLELGIIAGQVVTILNISPLKKVFLVRPVAHLMRIEHWGGRFNGKHYKMLPECVKCGCCVNICPTKNITIENGELKFGKKCIMCMRCSFLCQKNAIKIGFFNKCKVNGANNFNNPNDTTEDMHKRYCKKAYERYFADCEKRIAEENAL